ncbi:MAG: HesB/IscA family protein [Alphaproteobacteria bacterium]
MVDINMDDPFAEPLALKKDAGAASNPVLGAGAAARIHKIAATEQIPGAMLRLRVLGGGCSGYQYKFELDWQASLDDFIATHDGASLLIDPASLPFLENAVIDFVDELGGAYFKVENPAASSGCGCGTSFAI